jgi:hypothetical protein
LSTVVESVFRWVGRGPTIEVMTSSSPPDLAGFVGTVPDGVVRAAELRASGVPGSDITARCRPGGPWQRLLPGVLLLSGAEPSRRQRLRAALVYAGGEAAITGLDAAGLDHDLGVRVGVQVHVLVPTARRVAANGYVVVEHTTRMPVLIERDGLRYAPLPRAVLDAARREHDAVRLRALLSGPVLRGLCSVAELRAELDAGNQQGSAAPRIALRAVSDGVVSFSAGLARRLTRGTPLPAPRWKVPIRDVNGTLIAVVDAWWDDVALAWEIDTGPDPQDARLAAAGVVVLRTSAERLRSNPDGVRQDLVQAFHQATDRLRPPVHGLSDRSPPMTLTSIRPVACPRYP